MLYAEQDRLEGDVWFINDDFAEYGRTNTGYGSGIQFIHVKINAYQSTSVSKSRKTWLRGQCQAFKGNIATELENWISVRKDSLYHALTQPIETPAIRNQHIVAFYLYLNHLSHDEVKAAIKNLVNDIHLNKVRNENTDAHFDMFYEDFFRNIP